MTTAPRDVRPHERRWPAGLPRPSVVKLATGALGLFLFALAITTMKEGARALAPLVQGRLAVDGPANALGFGWLFAYVVMSGSPVAAASLAFLDAGAVDRLGAFAMITGSRLGASLVVLLVGFAYVMRGRDRATSLSMGLLALTVTGVTYGLALVFGVVILEGGLLDAVQPPSGGVVTSIVDAVFDPIVAAMLAHAPRWSLFPVGLGIVVASFALFDRSLPHIELGGTTAGKLSTFIFNPWVMLALGAGITLLSMSVSLSISILVPLGARGLVRRENVVPYIMGANVTTFIDTLIASVLIGNPHAFTVVLAEMASIALVSVAILLVVRRPFERAVLHFVARLTESNRLLAAFLLVMLVVPLVLLVL